jgi:hypothetical protein
MNIICFFRGIFRSIVHLNIISGHNYIEKYDNKDIQILECETCGKNSIGYKVVE